MKDIIELLQKERIKTVDALKNGNKQELSYLQQIDKALGWLKLIEEKGLQLFWLFWLKDILNERNQTTVDSKRRNLP